MNEEEKLTEIFGEKEVTEDSIMSEARRIFKYQESVGNPYSMHVAFEFATKELGKLKQSQEASPLETLVIAPKWETPDEFGLYEIFDDGSYEFLEGELFWGLIEVKNNKTGKIKNEVYLCGINDNGLYAYDPENGVDYYPGWSLEDIQYCMRYEQKGQ